MKILSLCSGYGGLDMAVEQHFSAKTAYWSDVDETACNVMAARFPDAQPVGDLTTLDLTMLHSDIICAGYPCQPYSTSGLRKGESDDRNLWPYIRNTIGVLRPRFCILENVSGHVSLGAAGVVADLALMGYDAKWAVISAHPAPHRRKRWFCVATDSERREWQARHEGLGTTPRPSPESGERFSSFDWGRYGTAIRRWERAIGRAAPPPVLNGNVSARFVEWMMGLDDGHVTDIAASEAEALVCLGNGVVPQQARKALELLT